MSNCSAGATIVVRVAGAAIRMPCLHRDIQLEPRGRGQTTGSRTFPSRPIRKRVAGNAKRPVRGVLLGSGGERGIHSASRASPFGRLRRAGRCAACRTRGVLTPSSRRRRNPRDPDHLPTFKLAERGGSDRFRSRSLTFLTKRKPGGGLRLCPAIIALGRLILA